MPIINVKLITKDEEHKYTIRPRIVAKRLGIPFHTVYRLIERGDLDARHKEGNGVLVSERSIFCYLESKDIGVKKRLLID